MDGVLNKIGRFIQSLRPSTPTQRNSNNSDTSPQNESGSNEIEASILETAIKSAFNSHKIVSNQDPRRTNRPQPSLDLPNMSHNNNNNPAHSSNFRAAYSLDQSQPADELPPILSQRVVTTPVNPPSSMHLPLTRNDSSSFSPSSQRSSGRSHPPLFPVQHSTSHSISSGSQPVTPYSVSSTPGNYPYSPEVPVHVPSASAEQTPDSPGFPRRQLSLNIKQQRGYSGNHTQFAMGLPPVSSNDGKYHLHHPHMHSKSCCQVIETHSLSPRAKPKNLFANQDSSFKFKPSRSRPTGDSFQMNFPPNFSGMGNPSRGFPHSTQSSSVMNLYNNRLVEDFEQNNCKVEINGKKYENVQDTDFEKEKQLGLGQFGQVECMIHKETNTRLAVKIMRRGSNQDDNRHITNDLKTLLKCADFPHIVHCYGYLIMETEVWIFMELMTTCFDRLLKKLATVNKSIPEPIIQQIALTSVKTLDYLKDKHNVIHRDIKPSNILINRLGVIKICDFGISGRLQNSIALTKQVGCYAYMAPERIDAKMAGYDIRSDVWSLGMTLYEIATGEHPYMEGATNEFLMLSKVIQNDPPSLPRGQQFSDAFCDFIKACLMKDYKERPKYKDLMKLSFMQDNYPQSQTMDVGEWFCQVFDSSKAE